MRADAIRKFCLGLSHATEQVQWESLLFKVGGKMFALLPLEPAAVCLSIKCSPDDFYELTERPDVIPAPYLARAQWVALEHEDALSPQETRLYLRRSYDLVFAKLPKKTQAALAPAPRPKARRSLR